MAFYYTIAGAGERYRSVVPFDLLGPNRLVNDPELVRAVLLRPEGAWARDLGSSR